MSERMTDERLRLLMDPESGRWSDADANAVAAEAVRARVEEARKTALAEELASALAGLLREEPNIYEGRLEASVYVTVDALNAARAALRKAGRLP